MQANHLNINLFKAHLIVTDMSPHPTFAWSGKSSLYFLLSPLAVSETLSSQLQFGVCAYYAPAMKWGGGGADRVNCICLGVLDVRTCHVKSLFRYAQGQDHS